MAKIVDVYHNQDTMIYRRQLPIPFEESLVMVVDFQYLDLMFDSPLVKGNKLDMFMRKCKILSPEEFKAAFQVSNKDLFNILHQNVPCVGCRRSVERLFIQLMETGCEALEPFIVNPNGVLTFMPGLSAQEICTILHDHSSQLKPLVENQPRSKKSSRCTLHSLDTQRLRPQNISWNEIWDVMEQPCRDQVVQIHADALNSTMETYLHKHRFCTECRNKVVKAYNILIADINSKEKGYNRTLYQEVRKCRIDKHIHLPADTKFITDLIKKAEPELMGSYSRRERHAKTLEIAQEEVLTCLGICVFERLHRVHLRVQEEECTCKVFIALVSDALSRSFDMAVQKKKGASQVELLLAKEDQAKAQKKQSKKQKRRKKKDLRNDEQNEPDELEDEIDDTCYCDESKVINGDSCCAKCIREQQAASLKIGMKNDDKNKSKSNEHNVDNPIIKQYKTEPDKVNLLEKLESDCCSDPSKTANGNCHCATCLLQQSTNKSVVDSKSKTENNLSNLIDPVDNINSLGNSVNISSPTCESCQQISNDILHHSNDIEEVVPRSSVPLPDWSSSENSQDCGYSSENNNGGCDTASGTSSLIGSPFGSEIGDCNRYNLIEALEAEEPGRFSRLPELPGLPSSLEQLLDAAEDDGEDGHIPIELVQEFQSRANVDRIREELRETLRKNFDQLCNSKPRFRMRKCE